MNYIGQSPVFGDFPSQVITADGKTTYTLDFTVSSEQGILVFLNGSVQRPGVDFTASGTSIVFSQAINNGVQIFIYCMGLPKSTLAPSLRSVGEMELQVSVADAINNSIKVGDFGIGGNTTVFNGNIDLVNDVPQGFVFCSGGGATPATTGTLPTLYGLLWSGGIKTDGYVQEWEEVTTATTTKRKFYRSAYNGAFGPWREIYHSGSIVGTVSQASGVPTGAIIERGSSGNGTYIRWADGTQECYTSDLEIVVSTANQDHSVQWTFPAAFAGGYSVIRSFTIANVALTHGYTVAKLAGNGLTVTTAEVRLNASYAQSYRISCRAIGRWY